jgi:pimeloyl-ACP methyl ester carboxylesterase
VRGAEVTEAGTGEPLVVFVHGVLGHGRSFDRVAALLEDECTMRWYDRRGYASSIDLPGVPATVDRHVEDLVTVLDGRRAVVVGHSFGGVTAMGAAVRAPELVDALVLYETSVAWAPGWDDSVMQGVFAADDPEGAALRLMLGPAYDRMDDDERARRRVEASAFLAEEQSVRAGAPYDVGEVRAPVVYGRSDEAVMPEVSAFLAARIPRFELVMVPDAGHHAHRREPEAFADFVRQGFVR